MASHSLDIKVQSTVEKIHTRLLLLKTRKELTRADYTLSKSLIEDCDLLPMLLSGRSKITTVFVAANAQVLELVRHAKTLFPKEWYILPITVTPRMTCISAEMVRDIADEFSVLLRKLLSGSVSQYPDVISLGTTLHFDNTRFPGSLTWVLRNCPFITLPDRDVWVTCNMVRAHAQSDRFTTSSAEIKLQSKSPGQDLNSLVHDLTAELLSYRQGEVRISCILTDCIEKITHNQA